MLIGRLAVAARQQKQGLGRERLFAEGEADHGEPTECGNCLLFFYLSSFSGV